MFEKIKERLALVYAYAMVLVNDERGSISDKIIALAVALLMAGILLPIGIGEIEGANTTGWGTNTTTIWGVLGVFGVLAVALLLIAYSKRND